MAMQQQQKEEQKQQILNNNNDNDNGNVNSDEDKIYYNNFVYSYKTEITRKNSFTILKYFMKFLGVKTLRELVDNKKKSQQIIESDIKAYLVYLRNEKKISHSAAVLYLSVVKKFYIVNTDYPFRWKVINMYLGNDDTTTTITTDNDITEEEDQEQLEEDRPYTKKEVQKMFNAAQDIRVKLVISLMTSSGLRNGAVNILKIRDLEKIEKYNIYQITAYSNSKKYKYKTFCTSECAMIIDSYLEYRKKQGEVLKGNSPLIREQFNTNDKLKVNNPRHIAPRTIRSMINDVLIKYSSLRKKLPFDRENNRKEGRNPTMLTHGFRKFFNTECAKAGVYPDFIELMLGHKLPGMRSHYMKPDINTLLEGTKEVKGYVAAIDALTINDENRLKKENQELKEQEDYNRYLINKELKESKEENQQMRESMKIVLGKIEQIKNDFSNNNSSSRKETNPSNKLQLQELKDGMENMKNEVKQQQILTSKLLEIYQKRDEIISKKGFVTKEDEEAIENSVMDSIKKR